MARDPVCGMTVDEKSSKYKSEHKGKTYYFCMKGCKKAFDSNPEHFLVQELRK
ncbi:MAG: YHS domain-containing protein [Candidatus Thorarchaeota archaeon]